MSSDFTPELRKELLDDFYAECDELLGAIREGLKALEAQSGASQTRPLEELFRNTHSLKGISAIVGLRSSEQLAHAMEEIFRSAFKLKATVHPLQIDLLQQATQRVEQIAIAHRQNKTPPGINDLLQALQDPHPLAADTAAVDSVSAEPEILTPPPDNRPALQATFTPSPELDKRGVNVASVRTRLSQLGDIVSAVPLVKGKGKIEFTFTLKGAQIPESTAAWTADAIVFAEAPTPSGDPLAPAPSLGDPPAPGASLTPSHIVRVDIARLDDLMRIAGELVIHRSRLDDRIQQNPELATLKELNIALGRSLRELRAAVSRVRMVPIAELFTRMPYVLQDLMRGSDKKARVVTQGNQTEVDKYLVERLKEPLLHLVRNAFAHGIESAAERTGAGKPAEATLTLAARSAGERVIIQVRDDGRGVDPTRVAHRARTLGLAVPETLDNAAILTLLCSPGFSTRDEADRAAGRGVGMSVVENTLRELGGLLTLESTPGVGTTFTLRLPLTLSIADAIIVEVGSTCCAVPQAAVDEIIQAPRAGIRPLQRNEAIPYREGLLPLLRLQTLFQTPLGDSQDVTVLVTSTDRGPCGLVVDRVRTQREIVIRPLADPLLQIPGISGATELGDGRPILILDPNALALASARNTAAPTSSPLNPFR